MVTGARRLDLSREGVGPGDRVVLCLGNAATFLSFFVAAQALGAIPVPLPSIADFQAPAAFRERIGGVMSDCEPRVVVVDSLRGIEPGASTSLMGAPFIDTSARVASPMRRPPSGVPVRSLVSRDRLHSVHVRQHGLAEGRGRDSPEPRVEHAGEHGGRALRSRTIGRCRGSRSTTTWASSAGCCSASTWASTRSSCRHGRSSAGRIPGSRAMSHFKATFSCAPNFAYTILARRLPPERPAGHRPLELAARLQRSRAHRSRHSPGLRASLRVGGPGARQPVSRLRHGRVHARRRVPDAGRPRAARRRRSRPPRTGRPGDAGQPGLADRRLVRQRRTRRAWPHRAHSRDRHERRIARASPGRDCRERPVGQPVLLPEGRPLHGAAQGATNRRPRVRGERRPLHRRPHQGPAHHQRSQLRAVGHRARRVRRARRAVRIGRRLRHPRGRGDRRALSRGRDRTAVVCSRPICVSW